MIRIFVTTFLAKRKWIGRSFKLVKLRLCHLRSEEQWWQWLWQPLFPFHIDAPFLLLLLIHWCASPRFIRLRSSISIWSIGIYKCCHLVGASINFISRRCHLCAVLHLLKQWLCTNEVNDGCRFHFLDSVWTKSIIIIDEYIWSNSSDWN